MKRLTFILLIFVLFSCTNFRTSSVSFHKEINYYQFGKAFFFPRLKFKDVKGSSKVCQTPSGIWVWPKTKCVLVKGTKICLTPVPDVFPHIKISKVDSTEIKINVLSIFSEVGLFISNKKNCPEFKALRIVKKGYVFKNPKLGKIYWIWGSVHIGNRIFGPMSKPIKVLVKDTTPPISPEGGGYLILNGTLKLMWEKSRSPDVIYYEIQCGNEIKVTRNTSIELKLHPEIKWCKVYAVDRAGNKSKPFYIKIIKLLQGDNNEEKGFYSH